MKTSEKNFMAGWAETDITPPGKVCLAGQHFARVSEGIKDPVTATALAVSSPGDARGTVMVSCDLIDISSLFMDAVRSRARSLTGAAPGIIVSGTHTHAAPEARRREVCYEGDEKEAVISEPYGVQLDVMRPEDYIDFAAGRVAEAIKRAWENMRPSGICFGMGHAVIGRNRRLAYTDGKSVMYGDAASPEFSHVEGYEDHSVYAMAVYGREEKLSGIVVNVPCPAQVNGSSFLISADYWHDTRAEIRKRFGKDIFILAQCAPSGDISPSVLVNARAEKRMWLLKGRDAEGNNQPRSEIAEKITDAVEEILKHAGKQIDWNPKVRHASETVRLKRRIITVREVEEAMEQAEKFRREYKKLAGELKENPGLKNRKRWYEPASRAFVWMRWLEGVKKRYEIQREKPDFPVELSAAVIGEAAFASNPFELYLDYAVRIRERSRAEQTFLIQLAGPGTYLPTERAGAGGGYGAVPASAYAGNEAGEQLVEWTVNALNKLYGQTPQK